MHITFSVPSFESLKLLTIIEAEMDQNDKKATFYQIICYIGARTKNDLYTVCKRKIDSFGNEQLENTYTFSIKKTSMIYK